MSIDVERLLKGLKSEVIDERVKTTVKSCKAQGDWVHDLSKSFQKAIGNGLGAHQGIQEENGVIGYKT